MLEIGRIIDIGLEILLDTKIDRRSACDVEEIQLDFWRDESNFV